ncbi:hypothetical protein [Tunturiibacter gelidiferens]|uniref:hypothetical protein n=1 Tax=Tunturiibacter gelidiferens TaxID=3069689 RepID=UPI003D9B247E
MGFSFEVDRTAEGGGRRGRLRLPHGVVETPVFMPVGTAASVKAVPQSLLEEVGAGGKGRRSSWRIRTICICGRGMNWCGGWAGCIGL